MLLLAVPGVPSWPDELAPAPPEAFAARKMPVIKPARAKSPRIASKTGLHDVFYFSVDKTGGGGMLLDWL